MVWGIEEEMNLPVVRGLMKGGMVVIFGKILVVEVEVEVEVVVFVAFGSRNFEFVGTKLRNHVVQG